MNIFRNKQVGIFLGGALTAVAGKMIVSSPKTRDAMVKTMAKGMQLQKDAQEYVQNVREDAEDLVFDAQVVQAEELAGKK